MESRFQPKLPQKYVIILETVITGEHGTGKNYAIEGYYVAGKTGTAQIPGKGGYLNGPGNYIYSFVGMAPKDDPD